MSMVGTQYQYTVWATGRRWAAHAKSPFEWVRLYGFHSEGQARRWAQEALDAFIRNDRARGVLGEPPA